MRIRALAIVVASLSLMTVGCATKKFVREEISKSESKTGSDIGKVDTALSEEKARTSALGDQLGQTKVAVQQADTKATEATSLAKTAQARADEAMTKADETSARLTRLWANRNKRVPGDSVAILFKFDKAELDDRGQ